MNILVSRHASVDLWVKSNGIPVDKSIPHLSDSDIAEINEGDVVVGVLPMHITHELCSKGVIVWNLEIMNMPPELRGKELSVEQMNECGARLRRYNIDVVMTISS